MLSSSDVSLVSDPKVPKGLATGFETQGYATCFTQLSNMGIGVCGSPQIGWLCPSNIHDLKSMAWEQIDAALLFVHECHISRTSMGICVKGTNIIRTLLHPTCFTSGDTLCCFA